MAKLTNKEHEIQQLNRIKKLENDLVQQKSRIDKLEKRIQVLEKDKSKFDLVKNEIFSEVQKQLGYIKEPRMKAELLKMLLEMKKKAGKF